MLLSFGPSFLRQFPPIVTEMNANKFFLRLSAVWYHAYTLFLFTKSDVKTILIPIVSHLETLVENYVLSGCNQSAFAVLAAPRFPSTRISHILVWVWLHLLQFCVSNQVLSVDEDRENKPWRPLPARRISIRTTRWMRWFLFYTCLLLSFKQDCLIAGTCLTMGIYLNNDMQLDRHWLPRNLCCGLGYWAFNHGATLVACDGA